MSAPPFHLLFTFAVSLDAWTDVTRHSFVSRGFREVTWARKVNCGCLLVGKDSFHLRLLNCPASRVRSRVAGLCSVMVEMSSCLGPYGPSSSRQKDPYVTARYTASRLHFNLLLNTIISGTKFLLYVYEFELRTANNTRNRTLLK
jgi:hypothetical protein